MELKKLFYEHKKWLESEGEDGEQLVLENICSNQLTNEQVSMLVDSVITDCTFNCIEYAEIDFYHTEFYSCNFSNVRLLSAQFAKSEINDTAFIDMVFENCNFINAEIFDCVLKNCELLEVTFASVGIWNTIFENCVFNEVDFENAYIENMNCLDSHFINPLNLEKATKIELNVGTKENPVMLNTKDSIEWIMKHSE